MLSRLKDMLGVSNEDPTVSPEPRFPDFLGIGAQKAATTWLAANLASHPEIWIPQVNEVHYFDKPADQRDGVERVRFRDPEPGEPDWEVISRQVPRDDRWYASVFAPAAGRVAGEITPAYAKLGRRGVARVHRLMPEAKIIFFMRNPVERVWSSAVMGFERRGKSALDASPEDLLEHASQRRVRVKSDYLATLERWGRFYPADRIFVGFTEDVRFFPGELLGSLYRFLGVDGSFRPEGLTEKVHSRPSGRIPSQFARHLAETHHADLKRLAERFGGYAGFWLMSAEEIIEGHLGKDDQVPYPLWGSSAWERWTGGSTPLGLQSGLLATL